MNNLYLAVIGKQTKNLEWRELCNRLQKPQIQKYPNGYEIATFNEHGVEVFFAKHKVSSVVFYGAKSISSSEMKPFQGEIFGGLKFGQTEQGVNNILGNLIYSRLESPPDRNDKCIKANFYKFGEFCLVPRFDSRANNEFTYLECMDFATASHAHGFN